MSRPTSFCTNSHFHGVRKCVFGVPCEACDKKTNVYTYIRLKIFYGNSYSTFIRNRLIPYTDVTRGRTDTSSHL